MSEAPRAGAAEGALPVTPRACPRSQSSAQTGTGQVPLPEPDEVAGRSRGTRGPGRRAGGPGHHTTQAAGADPGGPEQPHGGLDREGAWGEWGLHQQKPLELWP